MGEMYIEGATRSRETAISVGSNELAEGLMLLRASTLKIIRLQLAIERRDRQVALTAVDDLVSLDRRLQIYLEGVPATSEQLMLRRELDSERAALNEEKLPLGAEILRRPADIVGRAEPVEQAEPALRDDDWLEPVSLQIEFDEQRRSRWWWLVIGLVLALAAGAAAAYYFVGDSEAPAWLDQALRIFQ